MQTLRKLPTQRPTSTAATTITGSAPTQHLVEQDARGNGNVQRLGAARERDRDALCRDRVELRPDSRSLVSHDHCNELLAGYLGIERARERHTVGRGGPQRDAVVARPRNERPI